MSTFIPSVEKKSDKKWFLIDAKDKNLGDLSVKIANILRGRDRVDFINHLDLGSYVVVINASKVLMSKPSKWNKMYHTHSGYLGGLKSISAEKLMEKNPIKVLFHAVSGMIPKNKLKKNILTRFRVFPDNNHNLEAQKPILINV